eukprot:597578-Pelagomonas_calceolata.AAC.5
MDEILVPPTPQDKENITQFPQRQRVGCTGVVTFPATTLNSMDMQKDEEKLNPRCSPSGTWTGQPQQSPRWRGRTGPSGHRCWP